MHLSKQTVQERGEQKFKPVGTSLYTRRKTKTTRLRRIHKQ